MTRILEAAGYSVVSAVSGNEAAALAEKHQPDLIFLDIIMEDGDGYKACRAIKRSEATRDIPVIMVSSKSNPVDKKWAERLGAAGYVVKPYSDEEIVQAIDSA
ncbi:MAG: Two-component system response regulator [uncultured Thiotrichaceae bacterium]|uniref:Two-component system response regulator n=1 Tax=uncultured Thiotrichaceae bacterium TaxID=298394 RepID=A0A6S6TZ05_9GAMM|nr:MAG: Two-component system response regulator [uncultured Thiotrichaceae bacterium]